MMVKKAVIHISATLWRLVFAPHTLRPCSSASSPTTGHNQCGIVFEWHHTASLTLSLRIKQLLPEKDCIKAECRSQCFTMPTAQQPAFILLSWCSLGSAGDGCSVACHRSGFGYLKVSAMVAKWPRRQAHPLPECHRSG